MSITKQTIFIDNVTGTARVGAEYVFNGRLCDSSLFIYTKHTVNITPKCDLPVVLSYASKGMLFDIVKKFMKHDNILIVKERGGKKRYATRKDLYSLVAEGQSYMTGYRKLSPLFSEGILHEFVRSDGEKYIQVHPAYFTYGNKVSFDTYAVFKLDLQDKLGTHWTDRLDKYIADSYAHSNTSAIDEVEETIKRKKDDSSL